MRISSGRLATIALGLALLFQQLSSAEVTEIGVARQFGVAYLPLMVMEHEKLLDKHARAQGLSQPKVNWMNFSGGNMMNDALLSGSLHFAAPGFPALVALWTKTAGTPGEVRAVSGISALPQYLITRNPAVKSVADFTEKDRIALPTVKVSGQAIMLQMAAEKAFGFKNYDRLDARTVAMAHPDATAQMLSNSGEITAHFTWAPFSAKELARPGLRVVLSSNDIFGGPITAIAVTATKKFMTENPKTYAAFVAAQEEATAFINRNPRAAAEIYAKLAKDTTPVEELEKMITDPLGRYTMTPINTMKLVDFMYRTGAIKVKPASWKDLFFPNVHGLPGS